MKDECPHCGATIENPGHSCSITEVLILAVQRHSTEPAVQDAALERAREALGLSRWLTPGSLRAKATAIVREARVNSIDPALAAIRRVP